MDIKKQQLPAVHNKQLVKTDSSHRLVLGSYVTLLAILAGIWLLNTFGAWRFLAPYQHFVNKLVYAGACSIAVLLLAKLSERIFLKKTASRAARYNMVKVIHLLSLVVIVFVVITFLNANWYAAAVSLGLISLLLGFAFQTPIASLIGWFYIVIRLPYKVGDRIQLGAFAGDVVEINYLDTTLWEISGRYLTNDVPSGRLIRFPNSLVFQQEVYNYSWNRFPYIWNEISFHVAYESDLAWIETTLIALTRNILGDGIEQEVKRLREQVQETAVKEDGIRELPFVQFRTNPNTWIEVLLIYLVEPANAADVRSSLIKQVLDACGKHPDKAMFPRADSR